jgi:hypothetical protein
VGHVSGPSQQPRTEAPEPARGRARPVLRVIQGGVTRRRRLDPPGAQRPTPDPEPEETPLFDETPIYLRPIPAWLPRLW